MAYGTAFGSNLTDLGRNLVASETTRNQLQAALAAVAAQENIARTQAGSSRYSTDAQREANQLNQAFRAMENQRLRDATQMEAGLRDRDIISREAMNRFQFAPNTPAEREKERQNEIDVAKIIAASQSGRLSPQAQAEWLRTSSGIEEHNKLTGASVARANAESTQKYDDIIGGRHNWFGLGTSEKQAKQKYLKEALLIPGALVNGEYLIPEIDEASGRVKFRGHNLTMPSLSLGPESSPTPSPTKNPAPLTPNSALDPVLPDLMLKSKLRVSELMRRGFSETDAEFKAMAELPVSARQRISGLLRGVTPLPESSGQAPPSISPRAALPFADITPIHTDPDPEVYPRPTYVPEPLSKVAGEIAANAPLRELVPRRVFSNPNVRGGWQGGINTDAQAASFIQQYLRQLESEAVRLGTIIGQRGARERSSVIAREIQNIQNALK